jgi:hypothetical protein
MSFSYFYENRLELHQKNCCFSFFFHFLTFTQNIHAVHNEKNAVGRNSVVKQQLSCAQTT